MSPTSAQNQKNKPRTIPIVLYESLSGAPVLLRARVTGSEMMMSRKVVLVVERDVEGGDIAVVGGGREARR